MPYFQAYGFGRAHHRVIYFVGRNPRHDRSRPFSTY